MTPVEHRSLTELDALVPAQAARKESPRVVHRGEAATRAEADASIAVVEDVISHMVRHYYDAPHVVQSE